MRWRQFEAKLGADQYLVQIAVLVARGLFLARTPHSRMKDIMELDIPPAVVSTTAVLIRCCLLAVSAFVLLLPDPLVHVCIGCGRRLADS